MLKLTIVLMIGMCLTSILNAETNEVIVVCGDPVKLQEQFVSRPLRGAGIDINSNKELIVALQNNSYAVRYAATEVLMKRNEKAAIPAFKKCIEGKDNDIILRDGDEYIHICQALYILDENKDTIIPVCNTLLKHITVQTHLDAAGLLAQCKDTRGWPFVKDCLQSKEEFNVFLASRIAPFFHKLPFEETALTKQYKQGRGDNGSSKDKAARIIIDVLATCIECFKKTPDEAIQLDLMYPISQLVRVSRA